MSTAIALNTDVGESFGAWVHDDRPLLDVVDAANVACGFHAGDPDVMRRTCDDCARRGVAVGAHVSYRDLAGFGRRFVDVARDSLVNDIVYQIGALTAFAAAAGTRVGYVKAHGALYHASGTHPAHADALVKAVRLVDAGLPLVCLPGTEVWERARAAGLSPRAEAFLDRGYTAAGGLVPRGRPGDLLRDPAEAAARAVSIARDGRVTAVDGTVVSVRPAGGAVAALCVHGDTPGADALARAARAALTAAGFGCGPEPLAPVTGAVR
ncbi:LamB/YcsF family protein [Pseudonocardia sp. DR1-2]|uniref:LamB/YcsF family protein n=1 Tax=Pseudonocardia sp. DR1-2 TaxID=2951168 RepID=UPI0020439460|nr:5-oxoprolinase subunit PxpA [Pseudonocardia sp. DR1-2]MCM3849469.1 LamB/YcsF family protein [Pseudonocardia sp. DR1-2]